MDKLMFLGLVCCSLFANITQGSSATDVLEFRSFFMNYSSAGAVGAPKEGTPPRPYLKQLDDQLEQLHNEGYNVAMWFNPGELSGIDGSHALIRHEKFPEARELTPEDNENRISEMKWLFAQAKKRGMSNFIYFNLLQYTPAFARAHGLDKPLPFSPTVHPFQRGGYGGDPKRTNLGVRNELTRAYTEAVFTEFLTLYKDIDGFYGSMGETVPGKRSTFYKEAIVPALTNSGRHPVFIALQWQHPLKDYLEDIAPKEIYDNTWLGWHAYNSEQITDAQPYPCLVKWARVTGLPTVSALYPANIKYFPFNSPRLAFEITQEMKRIPNFKGFMFWNHPGPYLAPLFQKALGYYASCAEDYSDEPWIKLLTEQYGDRTAAEHFLKAYNISGCIIPETCAQVFNGGDFFQRELAMPYHYFNGTWSKYWQTSPARSTLIPVEGYARYAASSPDYYKDQDGSDWTIPPYKQEVRWGNEGGSEYGDIPPIHMKKVRQMGEDCFREAQEALKDVKRNMDEAQRICNFMQGYALFSRYYERKVAAATSALIYYYGHRPEDKAEAEKLADEALACYIEAATFYNDKIEGSPELVGRKAEMPGRIENEKKERQDLATLFKWPVDATSVSTSAAPSGSPAGTGGDMGPLQQGTIAMNLQFRHGAIDWLSFDGAEAFVIVPNGKVDPQRRWVWIAPPWLAVTKDKVNGSPLPCKVEYEFYVEEFLSRGFHVVGLELSTTLGSPTGAKAFDKFYELLTLKSKYQLNPKVCLLGQSNGGLIVYGWAFRHPEKVDCIVGIMPALDLRSWPGLEKVVGPGSIASPQYGYGEMTLEELEKHLPELNPIDNLKPLADAGVEIFHIHGDSDHTVPLEPNSGEAQRRYQALGGFIEVKVLKGVDHSPGVGYYDSQELLRFLTK